MFKTFLLVFKALHDKTPHHLRNLPIEYTPEHSLRSSDQDLLVIPQTNRQVYMTLKPCDKWDVISSSIEACIADIIIWG